LAESRQIQEGYLLIADISGYTSFMTGSEFEHAQAIIEELTKLVVSHAHKPIRFVKLEGDAVFCYIPAEDLSEGDRILDLIEACYFDFAGYLADMKSETTCPCAACANMHQLDLKFFAHFGQFLIQRVAGTTEDIAGPDVILVHRLMKNRVEEKHGLRAYALLTEACLERVGDIAGLQKHTETYEHIGTVNGALHDLRAALSAMKEARRVVIAPEEADVIHEGVLDSPPELLWQYFLDPELRMLWQGNTKSVVNSKNTAGRLSVDGETHCVHGGFQRISRILDARPFHYFTVLSRHKPAWMAPEGTVTFEFDPIDSERTRVSIRMRISRRDPLTVFMTRKIGPRMLNLEMNFDRLAAAIRKRSGE
jgi:uncharacterized protein YndB with AHSA1/START domain